MESERARALADGSSIPMLGLIVYFYSRGLTDELGLPVHVTMPIRVSWRAM